MVRTSNGVTVTQSSEELGGCRSSGVDGPQRVGRVSERVMTASEGVVSIRMDC